MKLEPQLWIPRHPGEPTAEGVIEPHHLEKPSFMKPRGGMWTSTLREDGTSDWERWCLNNEMDDWVEGKERWLLEPDDASIFVIDSQEALEWLFDNYGFDTYASLGLPASPQDVFPLHHSWGLQVGDFIRDFDALHLTEPAFWRLRMDYMFIYGWDCESTFWARWKFTEARRLDV